MKFSLSPNSRSLEWTNREVQFELFEKSLIREVQNEPIWEVQKRTILEVINSRSRWSWFKKYPIREVYKLRFEKSTILIRDICPKSTRWLDKCSTLTDSMSYWMEDLDNIEVHNRTNRWKIFKDKNYSQPVNLWVTFTVQIAYSKSIRYLREYFKEKSI